MRSNYIYRKPAGKSRTYCFFIEGESQEDTSVGSVELFLSEGHIVDFETDDLAGWIYDLICYCYAYPVESLEQILHEAGIQAK